MRLSPLALCLAAASSQALATAPVAAPVTSVVLYPGSATITRSAQVAAGATELLVARLPANFDPETLRVQADSGIRIGDVVTRDAAGSEAVNPAEADLNAKIQSLNDQKAALEAEAKSAEIVKGYLERLQGGTPEKAQAQDPKALAGVLETIGRGASDALQKMEKLKVQQRELDKKLAALQRDLARVQSGTKDQRALSIALAAPKGGTVTLSYQLRNAGWQPGYRASLDSGASTVDLERLATLSQNTGEDWSNVKLTLSTSQPRNTPTGAEPQPWLLSYRPPQANPPPPPMAAPAPMAEMARMVTVSGSRSTAPVIENLSAFASEFEVPGRVTLPSDGRTVSVTLSRQTLAVRQHVRVAPRLERFATVMAEAPRPDGVWPAGNMQLFRDGSFIGSTRWNMQDSERAVFAFGRDDLIKVALDPVEGMSGSKGLFGGRGSRHTADVFTLTNRHRTPVDILVLEAGPVSTSEEIKVQATYDPKPSMDSWEKKRGVVAWKQTLGAGASARFRTEYQIDYPKEGSVAGLR